MRDYAAEIERITERSRKARALIDRVAARQLRENRRVYLEKVAKIKAESAVIRAILDRRCRPGSKEVV